MSLLPESPEQLENRVSQISGADLLELRLDHLPKVDFTRIRKWTDIPIIITVRSKEEGGFWEGTEDQQIDLLQRAIHSGVEYIDIEWKQASSLLPKLQEIGSSEIVLSFHTSENRADVLLAQFREMLKVPAHIYKLIFTACELKDNLTAFRLIEEAKRENVSFIIHAMGEAGKISRLWGAVLGNSWTFVSLDEPGATASGQISLQTVREDYFLQEKSENVRLVGLIGYPTSQSSGWRLHNRLLHDKIKQGGDQNQVADFLYVNFPVRNFAAFWDDWEPFLFGLSVTLPHKQTVIPYLKKKSPEVKLSGVCNTIYRENGRWTGINADLLAIEELLRPYPEQIGRGTLVIGSGSTARSAISAVKRLGSGNIFVTGRNQAKGEALADIFGAKFLLSPKIRNCKVGCIIHTTPVGMFPNVEQMPPGSELFEKGMVVFDVVYNPVTTRFLKAAEEKDCTPISGKEMFLLQAARQFEIYSGIPVSPEEVRGIWDEIHPANG